ncbi:hypothetical protein [Streptomyces marianii]|uniref:Uncharacterized protein n=1 Tax=Streptomyces marianii TaxID=1817406 RepID=A0A5R9DWT6_9ACTN|nr:hypothetical protein [Streptomyces marianii]TLQ42050.1 hypothetical protein FEF34_01170 [Streptomyces marianii]
MAGAALLGLAGATPAFAEGSWSSYIANWTSGKESRRWTDRNSDAVSTSVAFPGCSTDSNRFSAAQVKLWKDVFGPDDDQGTRTNYCNTVSWGDKVSGTYYSELAGFAYDSILDVNRVVTRY